MYYSTVDFSRYLIISSNLIVLDVMVTPPGQKNLSYFPRIVERAIQSFNTVFVLFLLLFTGKHPLYSITGTGYYHT
jgi:hypothetical protein